MAKRKIAKSHRNEAENAAVWLAYEKLKAVKHVKAIRSQWQRIDIFASDVIMKEKNGRVTYIQVTTGQNSAVNTRKKKMEDIPWTKDETVLLIQMKERKDPINERRKEFIFKIWEYKLNNNKRNWKVWPEAIIIPREWFKSYVNK